LRRWNGKDIWHVPQPTPLHVVSPGWIDCGGSSKSIAIDASVGQPVNQPGISVEVKDDVLAFRKERVVILVV
jgi:hypothetical protein